MLDEFIQYGKGVDKVNQFNSYYTFPHRQLKWYRSIITWLIEISITNAFYIYKKIIKENLFEILEFRLSIIESLQRDYLLAKSPTSNETKNKNNKKNQKQTTLRKQPQTDLEEIKCQLGHHDKYPRGKCTYCPEYSPSKTKSSTWICLDCKIYVCINCFSHHMKEVICELIKSRDHE